MVFHKIKHAFLVGGKKVQKILIVEDDEKNNQMLKEYLENHGYVCTQAYSGSEAKLLFTIEEYDLILLDLMLPGIVGEELVSIFSKKVPVIVMSAKSGLDSKVEVLSNGADDYLCKPFDLPELLVRIQVQFRRRGKGNENSKEIQDTQKKDIQKQTGYIPTIYSYHAWTLNLDTQEMTVKEEIIPLTKHEFLIIELLIRNPKRVFTKQMIYEYAWGEEYLAEDKTINVHISNIRSKLKKSGTDTYIQTVWGIGFKLS